MEQASSGLLVFNSSLETSCDFGDENLMRLCRRRKEQNLKAALVSDFSKAELSFIYIQYMQCREKKDYEICRKGAIKNIDCQLFLLSSFIYN
jgi:hypothetical protein